MAGNDVKQEGSNQHECSTIDPVQLPYSIFTSRQKALIVAIISTAAMFSGFASNIYFPAIPTIASDLSVSTELINLTVTSYMIFQGLSPTLWGALADFQGRRITYICTLLIFFGACVGLAETKYFYQLLILRCLQSTGSASTIAIGAGVMGDITTRDERGGYMGVFGAGLLVPLAVGPVLGGVFAGTIGWRAIFWFLAIFSGAFLIILIIFLPETLRSHVGNGSLPAKGLAKSPLAYIQRRRHHSKTSIAPPSLPLYSKKPKPKLDFLAPLRVLTGKSVISAILFLSIYYAVWQMTVTALSTLFKRTYHLTEIQIGLTFIANGVGCIIGTLTNGRFLDISYRRLKRQWESELTGQEDPLSSSSSSFPLERARLGTLWYWSALQCIAVLIFGWTLDQRVHIAVPIICTFVLGWTAISLQNAVTTYLVDVFPTRGASASAALNLARCLMGAGGTAAIMPITNALGVGWCFTMWTGVMLLALGLLKVQMRWGPRWRREIEEKEKGGRTNDGGD
ncbi:MAG: hypothetical protein M1834_004747 [Cirrosporium novae-zelandiae]|nr:MAG: hypothetical protein M1834_004747 [Cirrosporium novae-zelandiae]